MPSWVATHFARHHVGIVPFVSSQRNDRQDNYDRNAARQDSPVTMQCTANLQSIIDISKMRLCMSASPETRAAWQMFLDELGKVMPWFIKYCQPKCVYRGGICCEIYGCKSFPFTERLEEYKQLFNKGE